MKILTIANEKGGVGKTFIATQFAFYCALKFGYKTCLIDLDQQGNASNCLKTQGLAHQASLSSSQLVINQGQIPESDLRHDFLFFAADDDLSLLEKQGDEAHGKMADYFKANLETISLSFDICIIDTNPNKDIRSNLGLIFCTHLVSPITFTKEPIDGISRLFERLELLGQYNPNLPAGIIGMLPNSVEANNFQMSNGQMLSERFGQLLIKCHQIEYVIEKNEQEQNTVKKIAGTVQLNHKDSFVAIKRHAGIEEAQALGLPIWQMENQQAAWNEMKRAFFSILEQMQVPKKITATADDLALIKVVKAKYGMAYREIIRQFFLTDNSKYLFGLTPEQINTVRNLKAKIPLDYFETYDME